MKKLKIDFIPTETFSHSSLDEKVDLILSRIKDKKIVVLNAQFKPEDEAALIQRTMENINKSFTGIEICSLSSSELRKNDSFIERLKDSIINFLSKEKRGITVIGPAKIIKQIKREPDQISLLTK